MTPPASGGHGLGCSGLGGSGLGDSGLGGSGLGDSGLEVSKLTVRYGETVALDGVDLHVPAGSIVAVIGPSGCGKSSLLRAIAGIEKPTAGSVELNRRVLDRVPTHLRGVGLMFQEHALFPHLTVGENVGFGLQYAGLADQLRSDRVGELLALVGLEGTADRAVDELSGGEAQRIKLASFLVKGNNSSKTLFSKMCSDRFVRMSKKVRLLPVRSMM